MVKLVRAASLTNYVATARQVGLDPVRLLRKHGMSVKLIAESERLIPIQPVASLLEESAQSADCPTFGLRMSESRQLADLGALSLLLTHQRTLGDVLRTLLEYQGIVNPCAALSIEQDGKTVVVHSRLLIGGAMYWRQSEELQMGVLCGMCTTLAGAQWRPRRVQLAHAAPPDLRVHQRIFRCPVEFDREINGLALNAADLAQPNRRGDPGLLRFARRFVDSLPGAKKESSVLLEVRKSIYLMLPTGRATIEQIAEAMGVNVRTLQRQLEEDGATFSELLNQARGELVLRYLENPELSLTRIAELLGYRMPSSFTRWFNAQFGMAPVAWRRTLTKEG
jgi:AraC-like DNA-binding protein